MSDLDADPETLWGKLSILSRDEVKADALDEFWSHKKALSPSAVVRVLLHEDVLAVIRREPNREAPARLDMEDVFKAVRDVLSKESLTEAGDLGIRKKRKRRRKVQRTRSSPRKSRKTLRTTVRPPRHRWFRQRPSSPPHPKRWPPRRSRSSRPAKA